MQDMDATRNELELIELQDEALEAVAGGLKAMWMDAKATDGDG